MTFCYRKANTTVISDTSTVDGACSLITTAELISPCCPTKSDALGSGNLCLSDFLCWESGPPPGGSGFLTASCTDDSYASDQCTEHCTDNPVPDVIYNPQTGLWSCCSWTYEGGIDCANPTSESWAAPAPQVLLDAASSSSSITGTATSSASSSTSSTSLSISTTLSGSSTITNTATTSPTSSASSSASSSSGSSSGLSTGAKAGIAIGVILGVAFIAVGVFFAWSRGRRSGRRQAERQNLVPTPAYHQDGRKGRTQPSGLGTKYRDYSPSAVEMHSNSTSELPTTAPARHGDNRPGQVELQ